VAAAAGPEAEGATEAAGAAAAGVEAEWAT